MIRYDVQCTCTRSAAAAYGGTNSIQDPLIWVIRCDWQCVGIHQGALFSSYESVWSLITMLCCPWRFTGSSLLRIDASSCLPLNVHAYCLQLIQLNMYIWLCNNMYSHFYFDQLANHAVSALDRCVTGFL